MTNIAAKKKKTDTKIGYICLYYLVKRVSKFIKQCCLACYLSIVEGFLVNDETEF